MKKDLNSQNMRTRSQLAESRRIVVKIGSRILVQKSGRPNKARMRMLVRDISRLHAEGREIVVVSSGAIGAGMEVLGMKRRPTRLPELQMAAAIGQTRLMTRYSELFGKEGCRVGQVLLTHDGLKDRGRHLNARNTVLCMLRERVIPIVNENDVVAVDDIKFGDNDLLASLVVHLVQADMLILLTTVDGLREPLTAGRTRRVKIVRKIDKSVLEMARGKGSELSTGGMASKLQAAAEVAELGAFAVIADGRRRDVLCDVVNGHDTGTLLLPETCTDDSGMSGRKRWIAYFHRPRGRLVVDNGARNAILKHGKSLLPIGIRKVSGDFQAGAAVDIRSMDNCLFARGLVTYGSADIRLIMGKRSSEIASLLGSKDYDEVVHRDNMVLMNRT